METRMPFRFKAIDKLTVIASASLRDVSLSNGKG